jgi:hypothetical protein
MFNNRRRASWATPNAGLASTTARDLLVAQTQGRDRMAAAIDRATASTRVGIPTDAAASGQTPASARPRPRTAVRNPAAQAATKR